ncbi:MAG: lactate utilization protein [Sphaerochaetaceae bacterium]
MRLHRTIEALKANNMEASYLPTKDDVVPMLRTLMKKDSSCAVGGSVTLAQCKVLDLLNSGEYKFFNRYEKGLSKEQLHQVFVDSFGADNLLCSANAVTEHGELYCVDGTSNRVAGMLFGPRQVIVIVGINKIVPNLACAISRVKEIAAPANIIRLDFDTYCAKNGKCLNPSCDSKNLMAIGAGSCPDTICCNSVIFSHQREKGRIKVLFVGEELGY